MVQLLKKVYRFFKYTFVTSREKEYLAFHLGRRQKLINEYFSNSNIKKLQIGAQSNSIGGWLNVDIQPKELSVVYMDATEPFPFADNSFDYVYSEHMIEHIPFADGLFMLKECFRVLKPGGAIRISTPDLAFLIGLYSQSKNHTQQSYIEFSKERYFKKNEPAMDTTVINNFFRDWGHKFIHDEKSLRYLFDHSGFSNITRQTVGVSGFAEMTNVEQHGKEITDEYNRLESIIMEATKP
jgi:predicted SAM-dependent methyltransferase